MSEHKQTPQSFVLSALLEQGRVFAELLHLNREILVEQRALRMLLEDAFAGGAGAAVASVAAPAPAPAASSASAPASGVPPVFGAMEQMLARRMGVDPSMLASGDQEALVVAMMDAADRKHSSATPTQPTTPT